MKVRVKFTKNGPVKFIGHLDMMRYFQKAIRRSGLDIAYSEGYSPHMIMSFAAPLGVGVTSDGEYFDMELKSVSDSQRMREQLNRQMADGVTIVSIRQIGEEKAANAMSLVAAADYLVTFRAGKGLPEGWETQLKAFLEQKEIRCVKKTKKGEREVDIRPGIYRMAPQGDGLFLQVSSGSAQNVKPEQVIGAFAHYLGTALAEHALMIHRLETYAELEEEGGRRLIPLEELGTEIA